MKYLEKINGFLNKILVVIAGIFLVGMVFLVCTNIVLRGVWVPLKGTFELVGFFGAIVAAFSLGQTQIKGEHIAVDVLINRFPQKIRKPLSGINHLIGAVFFALIAWQTALRGTTLWRVNELSETLRIAYFPFIYGVALGCAVISLVLLTGLTRLLISEEKVNQ